MGRVRDGLGGELLCYMLPTWFSGPTHATHAGGKIERLHREWEGGGIGS